MNNKGFTIIQFLGNILFLFIFLCVGLYLSKDTLAMTMAAFDDVSKSDIFIASNDYIEKNKITWIHNKDEYTCVKVVDLVNRGYFKLGEVKLYKDEIVKVTRDSKTREIINYELCDKCM